MGIFNNNKIKGILADRGLNEVSKETSEQIEAIMGNLQKHRLLRDSDHVDFDTESNEMKVEFLRALVEQNWIIIAQNEQMVSSLKEIKKSLNPSSNKP
ncbi:hypothetical protein [Liquorilactobacillus oeni]|uniref:Uncharacterized protein n=1 Tax=Liquorilactobacillus oeni DSM 19972 TaxID=1423777 RepID=A0A0R1M8L2_9LACO|nr:hypothetical protein [Liquorilactobacillus oeni]KRL04478.1 hypothetical protein FD46_GL001608 [Liquorilactobacillus oeni DSM 19972]